MGVLWLLKTEQDSLLDIRYVMNVCVGQWLYRWGLMGVVSVCLQGVPWEYYAYVT